MTNVNPMTGRRPDPLDPLARAAYDAYWFGFAGRTKSFAELTPAGRDSWRRVAATIVGILKERPEPKQKQENGVRAP